MSQKKWQKESEDQPTHKTEELLVEEVRKVVEPTRQATEMEAPINGYSAAFIANKTNQLLNGDLSGMKMQNAGLKESVLLRAIQLLSARLKKLEKALGETE